MFILIVHALAFWASVVAIANAFLFVLYLQVFDFLNGYVDELDPWPSILGFGFMGTAFVGCIATIVEKFI